MPWQLGRGEENKKGEIRDTECQKKEKKTGAYGPGPPAHIPLIRSGVCLCVFGESPSRPFVGIKSNSPPSTSTRNISSLQITLSFALPLSTSGVRL